MLNSLVKATIFLTYVPTLVQVDIHCREGGIVSLLRKKTRMKGHSCQNIFCFVALTLDATYFVMK